MGSAGKPKDLDHTSMDHNLTHYSSLIWVSFLRELLFVAFAQVEGTLRLRASLKTLLRNTFHTHSYLLFDCYHQQDAVSQVGQFGVHKPFSLAVMLVDNIQYISFNPLSFMSYGTEWKHDELPVNSAATQRCHDLMMSPWHKLSK